MSISFSSFESTDLLAEIEEEINNCVSEGIVIIVAAGNTFREESLYPATFQEVITVGAVDHKRQVALFSTSNKEVDLCQIGVDVISVNFRGGYINNSGTSMAISMISGIAAMLACKYKAINAGRYRPEPELYSALKMSLPLITI